MITSTGRPATIFQYNEVNRLVRSGTSGDDGALALNSATDRIQDSGTTMERIGNLLWQVSTSILYPTAGSATAKTVSVQRALLAGFTGNQAALREAADIAGNVARSTSTLDRASRLSVRTGETPGASDHATATALAGRTGIVHEPGSNGNITLSYDALGREESTQRPGITGAELTTYVPGKNLVHKKVDAAGHETALAYVPHGQPGAGQVQTVTAADTGVVTTEYDLLGRVLRTSGARQYPVAYTFDAYGQLETMTTWRDFATNAGAAVTTWVNDPATGLLASKRDDLQRAVGYTYDTAGRLETRTWARGITTTYGYHPVTRDMASVTYSDGTPAVGISYDRLGRQESATTAGTAQTVFAYRPADLLPDTETVRLDVNGDGVVDFERVFQRSHDALLRPTGFALNAPGVAGADAAVTYAYEPMLPGLAGRVGSVTGMGGGMDRTFTYGWHPARPYLPRTVAGPAHTVKHVWEDSRDVLHQRRNLLGALIGDGSTNVEVSAFLYTVNTVHQRTAVAATGTAVAAGSGWTWGYDALGQVTSATHGADAARNRGYLFDDIGNRKQSSTGLQPVTTTYTPNALNQYTAIAPPAPAPVFAPTYDFDGNQQSAIRNPQSAMSFEWDGENRLRLVRDGAGAEIARYHYDHAGRRVRKTLPGSATDTAFVYDGWNPVAEYSLATTPALLRRRNVWGLDLSGSVQGAGGVGGLLATESTDPLAPGVWFPTYDGNGNVSELLDPAGAIAAHYEYGPFGEPLTATGPAAPANPWRFSTKYQDAETGLLYYGYRYYDSGNGRWLSRDPIGERGGVNLDGMVSNNPVNIIDHLGLAEVDCKACNDCKDKDGKMTKDIAPDIDARLKAYKAPADMYNGEGQNVPDSFPPMAGIEAWADKLPSTNHSAPGKSKYGGTAIDPTPGSALDKALKAVGRDKPFLNGCANVCGKCIGTDKLGHMLQQGYEYQQLDDTHGAGTGEKYGNWSEGVGNPADYSAADQAKFPTMPFGGYGKKASGVVSQGDLEANKQGKNLYDDVRNGKFKTICDYFTDGMMKE